MHGGVWTTNVKIKPDLNDRKNTTGSGNNAYNIIEVNYLYHIYGD